MENYIAALASFNDLIVVGVFDSRLFAMKMP